MATDSVRDGDNNNNMAPFRWRDRLRACVCACARLCVFGASEWRESRTKDVTRDSCQFTTGESKSERLQSATLSLVLIPTQNSYSGVMLELGLRMFKGE